MHKLFLLRNSKIMMARLPLALVLAWSAAATAFQPVPQQQKSAAAIRAASLPPLRSVAASADGAAQQDDGARRNFVAAGLAFGAASLIPAGPAWSSSAAVDYRAVAEDIAALIRADPDKGPTLIRLAWHSSGTYDKETGTGGSGGGTIRFKDELAHGGNAGLAKTAVPWLEPIHAKYAKAGLSYADLYTLAGGTCGICHLCPLPSAVICP